MNVLFNYLINILFTNNRHWWKCPSAKIVVWTAVENQRRLFWMKKNNWWNWQTRVRSECKGTVQWGGRAWPENECLLCYCYCKTISLFLWFINSKYKMWIWNAPSRLFSFSILPLHVNTAPVLSHTWYLHSIRIRPFLQRISRGLLVFQFWAIL